MTTYLAAGLGFESRSCFYQSKLLPGTVVAVGHGCRAWYKTFGAEAFVWKWRWGCHGWSAAGVGLMAGWEESCQWEVSLKLLQESWPRVWTSHKLVQEETELSSCLHVRKQRFWLPQEPV